MLESYGRRRYAKRAAAPVNYRLPGREKTTPSLYRRDQLPCLPTANDYIASVATQDDHKFLMASSASTGEDETPVVAMETCVGMCVCVYVCVVIVIS